MYSINGIEFKHFDEETVNVQLAKTVKVVARGLCLIITQVSIYNFYQKHLILTKSTMHIFVFKIKKITTPDI